MKLRDPMRRYGMSEHVERVALVPGPVLCEHHVCRCARAAELTAMGLLPDAIRVHQERVRSRLEPSKAGVP
jgi:hypothetical protein